MLGRFDRAGDAFGQIRAWPDAKRIKHKNPANWGEAVEAMRGQNSENAALPHLRETGARYLYVDVSGMLAWSGRPLTGIPRVEAFVARLAIEDPDPGIRLIIFDCVRRMYRSLKEGEKSQLASSVQIQPASNGDRFSSKWELMREAFRLVKKYPYLTRDFDHHWTGRITKLRSTSPRYYLIKIAIRNYRRYRALVNWWNQRGVNKPDEIDLKDGIVLMPNDTISSSYFSECLSATSDCAFICHDLIPWLHPEFLSDQRWGDRFLAQLTRLAQSDVHALCTSDTTRAMLARFATETGDKSIRTGRFPLPSALYQTAKSLGRTSHFQPDQPFILYCSTIEIRKNHMLLARIWKRARDEGIVLPKLVCAGRWGWGVDELRAYLKDNPDLSQSIEFVGAVSDVELIDLYRSALFGVFPSYVEGWGFGASECLDFGIPVIVSTAPALREAARGLMPAIDPDDEEAWFTQIRTLSENAEERETLSNKIAEGYRPVTEHESWEAIKAALRSTR